ncbi:MAG: copper chaperone PCu(A)C [Pseudomonadota bacterium]
MKSNALPSIAAALLAAGCASAFAHVSLQSPQAQAGRPYEAVFVVGHGCDAAATTRIAVQVPAGFKAEKVLPRNGWTSELKGATATWAASGKEAALPNGQRGEFVLAGTTPAKPGALWFKVIQTCEQGSLEWAELPAKGTSTAGMKTPAALLDVLGEREFAAAQAQPQVEGAWVRAAVPGQQSTGAFMRLKAREAVQLVGVETPVAGTAEVHEMKMDGDVMRMRAVPRLDLKAGQALDLGPGGYHVMLQELKQPLAAGATVPMTLRFRNSQGVESRLELKLPVAAQAPGTTGAAATEGHKH